MDLLQQLSTALAGRYEIEREIGAGGMATVHLARDVKHNRKVALKVLRPELGAVLGPERFLSEIQVTANLQHPHLLPLFDSGEVEGHLFYVMPYVEGETLRQRLARERQLPVEEAVRIGAAVASALDYAHRHNVIHRDLKPENILLHEGEPLVSDFGIAFAVSTAGGARITQTGISLGTPQYMSPEQATGDRQIDARSDIYSLGAVLYEMLTGDPPHTASTVQAVIAKMLTDRPHSIRSQRPSVPEHVEAAVLRALEKLPADRFDTPAEFAEALLGRRPITISPSLEPTPAMTEPPPPRKTVPERHRLNPILGWLTAAAAVGVIVVLTLLRPRALPPGSPSLVEVTFPNVAIVTFPVSPELAISKDGSQLAFSGAAQGAAGIYLRRLNELEARLVRGAESGRAPTFSADGAWILFQAASGTLSKVPVGGGTAITIADSAGQGAHWGEGDEIVFRKGVELWRVSAQGGAAVLLARPDSERAHGAYGWPHVLPGSKAALVTLWKAGSALADGELGIVSLPDGEVTELGMVGTYARYLPTGHVVFARSDGSVYAAPFSLRRLRFSAPEVLVLEGVTVKATGAADLAISDNGTVVYKAGSGLTRLLVVDRGADVRRLDEEIRSFGWPRVSRDGRRIATTIGPPYDIWTYDLASRTLTRLTRDGASMRPEWSPDGQRVAYVPAEGGPIRWQPWDGSDAEEIYFDAGQTSFEISFGPPGTYVAIRAGSAAYGTNEDIWIAPADSASGVRSLVATPAIELHPRLSPDGRLLAYVTDESGRQEVYVRPVPGPGPRIQVSTAGGVEPVWSPDARELFYRGATHVIGATVTRIPELAVARRDTLFADAYIRSQGHANYDVLPSGDFLMVENVAGGGVRLLAILNWFEELRRKMQAGAAMSR